MKKHIFGFIAALLAVCSAPTFANTAEQATTTETVISETSGEQVAVQKKANLNQANLNTASAAELQDKLVGIGAKKAQAIVDYRTKNGNFVSIEQLTEVSGIGKATLDKNRDRIVLE